eukprot:5593986-Pleurochrysis_carterae.AAC.1
MGAACTGVCTRVWVLPVLGFARFSLRQAVRNVLRRSRRRWHSINGAPAHRVCKSQHAKANVLEKHTHCALPSSRRSLADVDLTTRTTRDGMSSSVVRRGLQI